MIEELGSRHWSDLLLVAAAALWIVFVLWSILSRGESDEGSLRTADRAVLASTLVVFIAWFASCRHLAPERKQSEGAARVSQASCASIRPGMTAGDVRTALGKPDEVASAADLRGPGAERWSYTALQCRVHLVDERVTLVE